MNSIHETFRCRLRLALTKRVMSICTLALRAGISPQSVYNWLGSDEKLPRLVTAGDVATVLSVSLDWLMGLTDEDPDWFTPANEEVPAL